MAAKIRYRVNTRNLGWTAFVQSGGVAGNPNDPTDNIVAVEISLDNPPNNTHITYAVNIKDPNFWTPLVSDGATSGMPGSGLAVDKIYMDLINSNGHILLYSVFVSPVGWTPWVVSSNTNSSDGVGIDGFPIQALRILLIQS